MKLRLLKAIAKFVVVAGRRRRPPAGFYLFYRAMPAYSGAAALPGLKAETRVWRDAYGVPHIFAASLDDAARALGYIHASERLYQMEIQRRAGQGRIAEIAGPDLVGVDRLIRTLGFYRLAESSFAALSPWAQARLQAYADGVNAFLDTHKNALPPEFLILGDKPEPWTPADTLVWGKLMSLDLSGNYELEALRAHLAQKLPPDQARWLFPMPKADWPITTSPVAGPSHAELDGPDDQLGALLPERHGASNEWVVSGARTVTGKPILANDPHLEIGAPILWYLARIVTPEGSVKGGTVPGLPGRAARPERSIAWGVTNAYTDVQDLFVETIDPADPSAVSHARRPQAVRGARRDDPRQRRGRRRPAHPGDAARAGHLRRRRRSRGARRPGQGDGPRLYRPQRPGHDRREPAAHQRGAQLGRVPRGAAPLSDADAELRLRRRRRRHRLHQRRPRAAAQVGRRARPRRRRVGRDRLDRDDSRSSNGRNCTIPHAGFVFNANNAHRRRRPSADARPGLGGGVPRPAHPAVLRYDRQAQPRHLRRDAGRSPVARRQGPAAVPLSA